jgi:hypothetical protein
MSFSSAYALREKWANEFELGIGGTLQERLLGLFTLTYPIVIISSSLSPP